MEEIFKDHDQYEKTLERIDDLMSLPDDVISDEEVQELNILVDMVIAYESNWADFEEKD